LTKTFHYNDWKDRLKLTSEDVVTLLVFSKDDELAYTNGKAVPVVVQIACRFLEGCYLLALEKLRHEIVDKKGNAFIKAHYPTLAVAQGAFIQYALNSFYFTDKFNQDDLNNLFGELKHLQDSYTHLE